MIEIVLAKLASVGLAAKVGVATGALALTGTAAAATGTLPPVAQDRIADAADRAGIEIPGGKSADHRADDEADETETDETVEEEPTLDAAETAETDGTDGTEDTDVTGGTEEEGDDNFGAWVSERAESGAPQEDGRQFGEDVSNEARTRHQPADRPADPADEADEAETTEGVEETDDSEEETEGDDQVTAEEAPATPAGDRPARGAENSRRP